MKTIIRIMKSLLPNPREIARRWQGIPYFFYNLRRYVKKNRTCRNLKFKFSWRNVYYSTFDRFHKAGAVDIHYFHQDIWAARQLYQKRVREHVDIGSRIDGFIGHIVPFTKVVYIDYRSLDIVLDNFEFCQGSITDLPLIDETISSLSCLHVLEHIGLGRYGDEVDPEGYIKAAKELSRVLAREGHLLLAVPVGNERLMFDGHRIFDPGTIVDVFAGLTLKEFSLIDDLGTMIPFDMNFEKARRCIYGCGLFVFEKV